MARIRAQNLTTKGHKILHTIGPMLYLAPMHSLMRNLQTITLLLALGTTGLFAPMASAQYNLDYGFCIGTGNYLGDIGGDKFARRDFVADLHLNQTRLSSHVFVRYRLSRVFAVRGQLGTGAPKTIRSRTTSTVHCPSDKPVRSSASSTRV